MGLSSFKRRIDRRAKRWRYRTHAHPTEFDWNWRANNFNRMAVINLLVSLKGGTDCRYLEIGCADNDLFDTVIASRKIGVDPQTGGTHRMTSDDFFAANTERFDVVFIDGLHEFGQVHKDTVNALACLNQGGWIAYHDLLPRNWREQHVPRLQGEWTGDCWKISVELLNSPDLDFRIFTLDYGVGVMQPNTSGAALADMRDTLREAQFDRFVEVLDDLPRVDWNQGVQWIRSRSGV